MQLKRYQADTLSVLRRFFEEARVAGPKNAYEAITREPEQAGRLGGATPELMYR
jgi:type III restriction enzyme